MRERIAAQGCVVALGMFDGCHNGHKRVLRHAIAMGRRLGCPAIAMTYENHPATLIAPARAPKQLQSLPQRLRALVDTGLDGVCLRRFTWAETKVEPEAFVLRTLRAYPMRGIVMGHSNTFGAGAKGTPALMRQLGARYGFEVEVVDTFALGAQSVHSTAIRDYLAKGDLRPASAMLGRLYALEGEAITGRKVGRTLGFPTVNVRLPKGRLLPRYGVYVGFADLEDGRAQPCILNLGIKPTIGTNDLTLEAFLLDFDGDLYGSKVGIRFFSFLRPEGKFASLEEMRGVIAQDEVRARVLLRM